MHRTEITLVVAVLISVLLLLFTMQKISDMRKRNKISTKKAILYTAVTFIQPLIGFILIFPLMRRRQ